MIPRLLYLGINCLVEFSTIMWDNKLLLFQFLHQEYPHFLNPNVKFFYLESMSVWGKKYKLALYWIYVRVDILFVNSE